MRVKESKGAILIILAFVIMVGLTGVLVAFMTMISHEMRSARLELRNIQAFYIAEAGRAKARWALTTDAQAVGWGESDISFGGGTYTYTTASPVDPQHVTITSTGYIPDSTSPIARRTVVEKDILFTAGGGTNLSLTAGIEASSEGVGQPASKANDESGSSKWMAKDDGNAWLKLDFGSSNTFDRVVVNGQKNINSVTIEYSSNGVTYQAVTNLVESPTWTYTFDSVEARYLKFNMAVNSKKKAEVNELESYDTTAGSTTLGQGEFSTAW